MKIGDANEFFSKFDKKLLEKFQNQFCAIQKLLKPGDIFNFECRRDGNCCTNRFGKDQIILSPYDIAELRRALKINSYEFLKDYTYLTLGSESQFPIALLKYENTNNGNKCPFLNENGCSMYKNRPLRCRLYPLGRAYRDGVSYFYMIQVDKECGDDKQYTLEQWLSENEIGRFCDWSDAFHELFLSIDHKKYKKISNELKYFFGFLLYDFDTLISKLSLNNLNNSEIMFITLSAAKMYLEKFELLKKQKD
ncbi:MAG: YkgJ family cysteine cluster protein [candidate division WOR-3 bacterium]